MYVEGFIDLGEVVDELGQEDVLENGILSFLRFLPAVRS